MGNKVGPAPAKEHVCCPTVHGQLHASMLRGEDFAVLATGRPWPGSLESSSGSSHASTAPSTLRGSADSSVCARCRTGETVFSVFAVFDGHNGPGAAQLARDKMLGLLEDRLPWGSVPEAAQLGSPEAAPWRGAVQRALVETLVELDWLFGGRGESAGCTATLVLQVGWLLTVANLGDSRAVLDLGWAIVPLTQDHRVATHRPDRRRLEAAGARVAPISVAGRGPAATAVDGVGPLRVWPGGLCLSRALGDFDVGEGILPFPFVKQVLVPVSGARLLLASDGLWDAFDKDAKVVALARGWSCADVPSRLVDTVTVLHDGLRDDTTVICADLMPGRRSFASLCARYSVMAAVRRRVQTEAVSGGCFCFGGGGSSAAKKPAVDSSVETSNGAASPGPDARPEATVLAELDVAALLGLMPEPTAAEPLVDASVRSGRSASAKNAGVLDEPASAAAGAWCDEDVAEELRRVVTGSSREWRRAMTCRYRGLYVPEPEPSGKWLRGNAAPRRVPVVSSPGSSRAGPGEAGVALVGVSRATGEAVTDGAGEAGIGGSGAPEETALPPPEFALAPESAPAPSSTASSPRGSLPRSSSHLFRNSVAADESEYAAKFGHYKHTASRGRLFPGGPGVSHSDVSVRPLGSALRGGGAELESMHSTRVADGAAAAAAAALGPGPPSSPSADSDPSVRPRTRTHPPGLPIPPPHALHGAPSPFASVGVPMPSAPAVEDSEPSVRVGTPRSGDRSGSSAGSDGDEELATAVVAREASRDVLRDNPRVHLGREDSVSEAAPAAPRALVADGLLPVRVVRRNAGVGEPGVASPPADAAAAQPAQQQCWAEAGTAPDADASSEGHKMPVILEASG